MRSIKIILFSSFIIPAALAIGGVYIFLTHSPIRAPHTNADWKTYTNTKYGYSISYPKNYSIKTTDYCGNDGCNLVEPTASSHAVYIERPGGKEAMRDYVSISLNQKSEEYFYVSPGEQSFDFEGYKAKIAEGIAGELYMKSLVIDRNDYIFHVSSDYNRTNGGVSFDILSTFRFVASQ